MELRYYLDLFRRWWWLLALSVLLGAGAALLFSGLQSPVYEAKTWAMIVRPQETAVTASSSLTDQQLADTFVALLTRRPVLDAASAAVGREVEEGQVSAQLVRGTQMLEVVAEADDPQDAATIANTLVEVLAAENERLQSSEFERMERSLEAQVAQVQGQIDGLQGEIAARKAETVVTATGEQAVLATKMDSLQREVAQLQVEIDMLLFPRLTQEEEAELATARAEKAQLELQLGVAQSVYEAQLTAAPAARDSAAEAAMLALGEEISALNETIDELLKEGPVTEPADQALLVEKQAALAQRQLALDTSRSRYLRLEERILEAEDEDSGGTLHEEATLSLYEQLYGSLLGSFESVRLARLQSSSSLAVVEEATPPEQPARPRVLINTVLGGMVALMAALGLVLALDYLDVSVKSGVEATALTGLPVLGDIENTRAGAEAAAARGLVAEPDSRLAESFRTLRANLAFAGAGEQLRTILVTSPEEGDGKTTVAANLAVTLARGGKEVAGGRRFARPGGARLFQVAHARAAIRRVSLGKHEGEALGAAAAEAARADQQEAAAPPARAAGRGAHGASWCATWKARPEWSSSIARRWWWPMRRCWRRTPMGCCWWCGRGKTSAEGLLAAVEQLQRAGAPILGIALNRSPRGSGVYQAPVAPLTGGLAPGAERSRWGQRPRGGGGWRIFRRVLNRFFIRQPNRISGGDL
jgi:capsular polysaccharide biosynthesis protein